LTLKLIDSFIGIKGMLLTKVFAKAGLDNETSAICKYQQQFGLDIYKFGF